TEPLAEILTAGGHKNTLGRVDEVIDAVLKDRSRLEELYQCVFDADAWVRMRAIDAVEKVCRVHPDWIEPYVDRLQRDLSSSSQPSIQWHLAEIYRQVELTEEQRAFAIDWMKRLISSTDVDWIAASNTMVTLAQFVRDGAVPRSDLLPLLEIQ